MTSSRADENRLVAEQRPDLPVEEFASAKAWERWLARNHARSPGVWLKIAKQATGVTTVSHAEALEVALCYGWIDGQRDRFDDEYFLQRFTPRRARSRWSKINRDSATALPKYHAPGGVRSFCCWCHSRPVLTKRYVAPV